MICKVFLKRAGLDETNDLRGSGEGAADDVLAETSSQMARMTMDSERWKERGVRSKEGCDRVVMLVVVWQASVDPGGREGVSQPETDCWY